MMDVADRQRLAREVFASLDGTPHVAVRLLAAALQFADGPIRQFADPLDMWADHLEFEGVTDHLALVVMASRLRRVAQFEPNYGALLEQIDGVEAAPWPQLAATLREARAAYGLNNHNGGTA